MKSKIDEIIAALVGGIFMGIVHFGMISNNTSPLYVGISMLVAGLAMGLIAVILIVVFNSTFDPNIVAVLLGMAIYAAIVAILSLLLGIQVPRWIPIIVIILSGAAVYYLTRLLPEDESDDPLGFRSS